MVFGHTERQQINRGNDRDSGNASDRGTRFSALINLHQPNNQGGRDQPRDQGQPLKRLAGAARFDVARVEIVVDPGSLQAVVTQRVAELFLVARGRDREGDEGQEGQERGFHRH